MLTATLIISIITIVLMICSILFFRSIKIKKYELELFWVIILIGAIVLLCIGASDFKTLLNSLTENTPVNPLKILTLFICMTILSIFLDELGFFSFLANYAINKAKTSQFKLFLYLYITVSVLTIFTSNDIIILTFTPFICYFSKRAKINPLPYLIEEFVAANTWSMFLIMGNPTNIYLASSYNINFFDYAKTMALPTIAAGIVSFGILYLLFRKQLQKEMSAESENIPLQNKFLLIVGIVHLATCTVFLAIASYIGIEMYLISAIAAVSLILFTLIYSLVKKEKPAKLGKTLLRAPWKLIPFVLGMYIIITSLSNVGVVEKFSNLLGTNLSVFTYGMSSFAMSNIVNNIPMSIMYYSVIGFADASITVPAVYASIIGSNIGAFLSPLGALAGIMWSSILNKHDIKFSYVDFIKYGAIISIPTILAALGVLQLLIL